MVQYSPTESRVNPADKRRFAGACTAEEGSQR
jgi:hypothetical protein